MTFLNVDPFAKQINLLRFEDLPVISSDHCDILIEFGIFTLLAFQVALVHAKRSHNRIMLRNQHGQCYSMR